MTTMASHGVRRAWVMAMAMLIGSVIGAAAQDTFTGTGNWNETARWSSGIIPGDGADVVIDGAVTLTNSTALLASYTLNSGSGRTHTFRGTNTALRAATVTINGTITHAAQSATAAPWDIDHRIWIVCTNLTLTAGGDLNASEKGFQGRAGAVGYGPASGAYEGGGAGHGGRGGNGSRGTSGGGVYGDGDAPATAGSGGAGDRRGNRGGHGGGVIRIEAADTVIIDGTIRADGGTGGRSHDTSSGGGSGGSIHITCNRFGGAATGILRASGGNSLQATSGGTSDWGGGGGGGRIAVLYDTVMGPVGVRFNTAAGTGWIADRTDIDAGQVMGTLHLPDTAALTDIWKDQIQGAFLNVPGLTNWTSSITISNALIGFTNGIVFDVPAFAVASANSGLFIGDDCALAADTLILPTNNVLRMGVNGRLIGTHLSVQSDSRLRMLAGATLAVDYDIEVTGANSLLHIGANSSATCGGDLTIDQGRFLMQGNSLLMCDGAIAIGSSGQLSATVIQGGGDLALTGGARLFVGGGRTNTGVSVPWSGVLAITGNVSIGSTCWIQPLAVHPDDGGAVRLAMSNLTVAAGGGINADGRGYPGRGNAAGLGLGAGSREGGGGGHGGRGGRGSRGDAGGGVYDSITAPVMTGSSGGGCRRNLPGGAGGGALQIDVSGDVVLEGTITANGNNNNPSHDTSGGAGSGGSIAMICQTIQGGPSAVIRANGGTARQATNLGNNDWGGGGGGGRIAVVFDPVAQSNLPPSSITLGAGQGSGFGNSLPARPGTIWLTEAPFPSTLQLGGEWIVPGFTNWHPESLTVSNGILVLPDGFALRTTNDLVLAGTGGGLETINSPILAVGGNLTVASACSLRLYSAPTNGTGRDYGTLVSVTGNLAIASNAFIYPHSQAVDGGSVLFRMSNLVVEANGQINADARGWAGGANTADDGDGPGGGERNYGGAGYGGMGADARDGYGMTYGSETSPTLPGSGGGGVGGRGGGLVRLEIQERATINGTISANGGAGTYGGSGGAIYLIARIFDVAFGVLRANGGSGSSKGGGGGRIALAYRASDGFDGTVSVAGGGSGENAGGIGTISRAAAAGYLSLVIQGDPERREVATPYDYGTHAFLPGTEVTVQIPRIAEQTATHRYYCMGWSLTNAAGEWFGGDSGTQAVFTMTDGLFLTWYWTHQFYLTSTANLNGSLAPDRTGWYTNGVAVTLHAVPDSDSVFLRWSGSGLPLDQATDHPLTVIMDRARVLRANFFTTDPAHRYWTGTGNWLSATNWSPPGLPGPASQATILSGNCTLTDPMTVSALTVSNGATLTFNGAGYYETNLSLTVSGNMLIRGTVTHPAQSATAAIGGVWIPDQGVWLVCHNLTVAADGVINVNSKGYLGGHGTGAGCGPGAGAHNSGAGHGGKGGRGSRGNPEGGVYGSAETPSTPGSGGGGEHRNQARSGHGGGLIRIGASGRVTLDGILTARGGNNYNSHDTSGGAGSGGSIFITCNGFGGDASGALYAQGGTATQCAGGEWGGGGGGGRIAVWIRVPESVRQRYGDGIQGGVVRTGFPPATYLGAVSADPGPGRYDEPDARGAAAGSLVFFRRGGTVLMVR